ncbi:putative acetyltransferase [Mycolicibacterium mageritense DSM 44476 = CIP 104973]|uniref:Acetyltransferase n=1 Tax=Mycolicibacterium mageritense TaxID=53462 RepID=A0AAI8TY47_MYCME|nr:GNAT family N-acetyltransferase [Mycolicibacterium mageritense]BBX35839.1 putative acetyltransferase [Mycolicibacterium mageritense]BDY30722.1 hypothetical protein hbim_04668 [Mycolicibacterium mageritense]GJJ17522.1 putative acetyltransferase [Mycolicibacterium mageritense]CDO19656.1 putative acetyltransferase [Mycolicibacterium mageritense DSM 44476 = CIP 104973]
MPEDSTVSAKSIDSDRVRLRKARDGDAAGIIETQIDERIRRHLGGPRSEPEVRALVESVGAAALLAAPGHFVVADKHTDEMLGTVLLDRRGLDVPGHVEAAGNELELTYVFRHSAWGHGYATEAARALLVAAAAELPEQPVLVITQSANGPSLNLAHRLGFEVVTTFEQFGAEQSLAVARLHSFRCPPR